MSTVMNKQEMREIDRKTDTLNYLVKALTNRLTKRDKAIAIDHVTQTIIAYRKMRSKRLTALKRVYFITKAKK